MRMTRPLAIALSILVSDILASPLIAHASSSAQAAPSDALIEPAACGGSCTSILHTESGLMLEVRSPDSGQLFRIVPLDLPAGASLGAFKFLHDTMGGFAGETGQEVQTVPSPPHGGTGTVTETAPFTDPHGSGDLHITYHFVGGVLRNVVVRKYYHTGYMPR